MSEDSNIPQKSNSSLSSFLNDNLSIITIIGVFGALSFFSINDSDQDLKTISVLLSIIVIFLFLLVLFDGIKRIWNNLKNNFNSKNFIDYVKRSTNSFNLIIFLTSLCVLIWLLISYLNLHTPLYFRVLLLLIIFFVSVIISAVTIPYILFKENNLGVVGGLWILLSILIGIVGNVFGLFNPSFLSHHQSVINTPPSLQIFILFLLSAPMFIWFGTFVKMLILMYKIGSNQK